MSDDERDASTFKLVSNWQSKGQFSRVGFLITALLFFIELGCSFCHCSSLTGVGFHEKLLLLLLPLQLRWRPWY